MSEKFGRKVKEKMVQEMKEVFSEKKGFVFAGVENIKASEIDGFRRKLRQSGSRYLVIKNRLAARALEQAGISGMDEAITEKKIMGAAIIEEDPVSIAKLLMEFAKQNKGFTVSKGFLEGRVLAPEKIKELAELPGREQLIAMVVGMMNGPVNGFVGVLSGTLRKLLYGLNAVKEKKEASA